MENDAKAVGADPPKAVIFHVQRFSLHDGPGIRTTIFFKGCPLRCAWCQNPESHRSKPEMGFYAAKCVRCFQCATLCPENAILMADNQRIDFSRCTHCGLCATACSNNGLVRIGKTWDTDALYDEILKDMDYFKDSGGGVTLSGGEPLEWAAFLVELLPRLRSRGIHITLETCGAAPWTRIERVLPYVDLIYFDLKMMNTQQHRIYTGVDNAPILENFSRLAKNGVALQARMPMIPGINDSEKDILDTAFFLMKNGHDSIHCLPYHNLGESKRNAIHALIPPLNLTSMTASQYCNIEARFQKEGIHAVFYDL